MKLKLFSFFLFLSITIFFSLSFKARDTIEIIHFEWDSDLILIDIVRSILEKQLGYQVDTVSATPAAAWIAVRDGTADAVVGSWLPRTHGSYFKAMGNKVDVLNKMTEGVKIGIAVPSYMPCNCISDLQRFGEKLDYRINGIEPGAGIMVCLERALDVYGLTEFEIMEGCESSMLASLVEAIKNQEWIAITAWSPHCMFELHDIKYLEDPEGIFGAKEYIAILGRKDLAKEMPQAYSFLSKFKIDVKDIEKMQSMMNIEKVPTQIIADKWIAAHQNEISEWLAPSGGSNDFE